jgi:hypothetical protein
VTSKNWRGSVFRSEEMSQRTRARNRTEVTKAGWGKDKGRAEDRGEDEGADRGEGVRLSNIYSSKMNE